MARVDYLIVGQGLAGSLLACLLLQRGRDIRVIDNGHRSAASRAAAGLINPITGERLNRPALVDRLLATAFETYSELERFLSGRFFSKRRVLRLLSSPEEAAEWRKRSGKEDYRAYVRELSQEGAASFHNRFGGFEVTQGGQIDLPAFIDQTRNYLARAGCLIERDFDYNAMTSSGGGVEWEDFKAGHVIFCEGYKLFLNPYFRHIALNPAKGEVLTLAVPGFEEERIVQCGKWIFRSSTGEIKAGTTYAWEQLDERITAGARDEIERGLRTFCQFGFEVIDHRAGVRPIVRVDNRPVAGTHPGHPRLAMLNGLGSKGALQAPFVAKELIAKLEESRYIHPGFDLCRESLWRSWENA